MGDYDVGKAFRRIEDELISSMIRNLDRHKAEEAVEGFRWSMWQAEQLKSLERYRQKNSKKYGAEFVDLNRKIKELIRTAHQSGGMKQEKRILQAISRGYKGIGGNKSPSHQAMPQDFFRMNERKLESLIEATTHDMERAETAVLRMANDQYRKIIFSAQVYANTGAGTYKKAVDMATKDFLAAGLNCIEYKNGARHTLSDYADMAIRTASKRAYLQGEGEKRQEWGISTVIMNKRGNPCPKCLPFVGKVLIDDVWSGGSKADGDYPLMSTAIAAGLYHPRCKDGHTTYFPGISTPPDDKFTKKELVEIEGKSKQEAGQQLAARQADKYGRLARFSLDSDNQDIYRYKEKMWEDKKNWMQKIKEVFSHESTDPLEKFMEGLGTVSNEDANILFQQALKRTGFRKSQRKNSYFSPHDHKIYVSQRATADTIAHELFHEIDNTYKIIDNGALSKQIKSDYKRLIKVSEKHGNSIENMLYSKYPEAFEMGRHGIKLKEKYRGVSDILNGMSSGKIRLGYRHEDSYWEKEKRIESETWAQYGRMIFQDDEEVLGFAEALFPETTVEVFRILKEMMK